MSWPACVVGWMRAAWMESEQAVGSDFASHLKQFYQRGAQLRHILQKQQRADCGRLLEMSEVKVD